MDVDFSARGPPVAQSTIQQLMYVFPCVSGDIILIGWTCTATNILESSKVTTALAFGSDIAPTSVILPLLMRCSTGAIVNHVTTQCQDQGRLLEEANRDLDVFKKAYYRAECGMQDHKARFELEKQTLRNEIRKFKVRVSLSPHIRCKISGGVSSCSATS